MLDFLAPAGIVGLIFGGCCSNVFTLEAIVKKEPDSGLLITFTQFILVALASLPFQTNGKGLKLKSSVPFRKWVFSAVMFFSVNMLNNWAFAFNISVPVHIILRSFGSVTTMAAGWLRGKRYSQLQVISVAILTVGVLVSAWADALSKGKSMSTQDIKATDSSFEMGLLVLLVAQLLSAYMGAYVEDVYAAHGKHWGENLFWTHLLSIPFSLPLGTALRSQYVRLAQSPPLVYFPKDSSLPQTLVAPLRSMPASVFYLLANAATQMMCITGVNLLGSKTSAVTVTIVLNIRKLVSFMLSIWLFGNKLSGQMIVGAVLVFGAGALYGWETTVGIKRRNEARNEARRRKVRRGR